MNAPQPQDLMLAIETVHVRFVLVWCSWCSSLNTECEAIEIVSFSLHFVIDFIFHYSCNSRPHARLRFTDCECKACSAIFRLC
jgi:hypothetical protein